MTRRNSDIGGHSGNQFILRIRSSLINAVLGADYATQRIRPKGSKRKTQPSTFEDNVVLEVRRLREQAGVKPKQIIEAMKAVGHVVTQAQVYAWLQYSTRATSSQHRAQSPTSNGPRVHPNKIKQQFCFMQQICSRITSCQQQTRAKA